MWKPAARTEAARPREGAGGPAPAPHTGARPTRRGRPPVLGAAPKPELQEEDLSCLINALSNTTAITSHGET